MSGTNKIPSLKLRKVCESFAHRGWPGTYTEVIEALRLPAGIKSQSLVWRGLQVLMWQDFQQGCPFAAASVVNERTNNPGRGYRPRACQYGRYDALNPTAEFDRFSRFVRDASHEDAA